MSDDNTNIDRKLAALLTADVVGYSRLMAEDDRATLATLTEYREVMREHINSRRGRVVDAPGDALLAEFPSAVQAVEAALAIQATLAKRNGELPENRRMLMRIGINLGDVIEQDGALYGDGVNIAARLEAMCEPGGICVSGTIFDQVEGRVQASFKYAGEQKVKNIERPIRAYHSHETPSHTSFWLGAWGKSRLIAAGLFTASLIAVFAWQTTGRDEIVENWDETLLAMPSGPVIAVLPFTNMSGDPAEDYFSDGLTEDIITELARFPDIHVLARNTTFQYKRQAVNIPEIAQKLGAQYVLEGSFRKTGGNVRINAQLIDGTTGAHVWADRFDGHFSSIFDIQDQVTTRIVGTLASGFGGQIQKETMRKANQKSVDQMEAYEIILEMRAGAYSQKWFDDSKSKLERAIALAPNYARARHEYAWLRLMGWIFRFEGSSEPAEEILENAVAGARLNQNDPNALRVAAFGYFFKKQLPSFERAALEAMRLAPYDAELFAQLGMLFTFSGQWERGISLVDKANAINPVSASGWYHSAKHYDYYRTQDYKQALEMAFGHPVPGLCETQYKFVAAYGQLGEPEKARPHWKSCEEAERDWSADFIARILRLWNFQEPFIEHYMEGIEKAGYSCRAHPCGTS